MWTLDFQGKIYIAWNYEEATEWNEHDTFDASSDGLSGKKEGFYFGNWLMPFKVPIHFKGAIISPQDYPDCMDQDSFPCETCRFFSPESCSLLLDKDNFNLSRLGFKNYQTLVYTPRGNHDNIFDAARQELLTHGTPLHYQVLTNILKNRYPALKISDRILHKVLRANPIFFRMVDAGVYQAMRVPSINKIDFFIDL
jgi:hypothetical protein